MKVLFLLILTTIFTNNLFAEENRKSTRINASEYYADGNYALYIKHRVSHEIVFYREFITREGASREIARFNAYSNAGDTVELDGDDFWVISEPLTDDEMLRNQVSQLQILVHRQLQTMQVLIEFACDSSQRTARRNGINCP